MRYYLLFDGSLEILLDTWGIGVTGAETLRCATGSNSPPTILLQYALPCRFGFCSRRLFSEFSFGAIQRVSQCHYMNVLCTLLVWINLAISKSLLNGVQLLALYKVKKLRKVFPPLHVLVFWPSTHNGPCTSTGVRAALAGWQPRCNGVGRCSVRARKRTGRGHLIKAVGLQLHLFVLQEMYKEWLQRLESAQSALTDGMSFVAICFAFG